MKTKICTLCKYPKTLDAFYKDRSKLEGLTSRCRECLKSAEAKRLEDPKHRKSTNARKRKYQKSSKGRRYNRNFKFERRYGITLEQYEAKAALQSGLCVICNEDSKLVLDHCHESGEVRGLICGRCNLGLGHFQDDPDRLVRAASYLNSELEE